MDKFASAHRARAVPASRKFFRPCAGPPQGRETKRLLREPRASAAIERAASRRRLRPEIRTSRRTAGHAGLARYAPRVRPALLLLCLVAASGCSTSAKQQPKDEPWSGPVAPSGPTEEVAVPSLGITLVVPAGTQVEHVGAGATFFVEPDTRRARSFSIEQGMPALVHPGPANQRRERTLKKNGALIRYEVRLADEGSGGAEAFLDGVIVVDQDIFAVHCHDQAEAPAEPQAEWCFEWLATAKLDSPGSR